MNENIQFTIKLIVKGSITFLDLNIKGINSQSELKVYRKATQKAAIIFESSNQSHYIKLYALHSLIHRLLMVPMYKNNHNLELNTTKTIARNNGCRIKFIDKMITKSGEICIFMNFMQKERIHLINHVPIVSNRICNIYTKLCVRNVCVNKNNFSKIFTNNKERCNSNRKW